MAVTPRILIIGCGPGSPDYLTPAARAAAENATVLVGSPRLLEMFPASRAERIPVTAHIDPLLDRIAQYSVLGTQYCIGVLVSGDPGLYSLAKSVIRRFGRENCRIIPGISSVQVAFARVGIDHADARILSAHGRTPPDLSPSDKIAILAGTPDALRWCATAAATLEATHALFLCENLTLPDERVRDLTPAELCETAASSLSIVLLINRSLL